MEWIGRGRRWGGDLETLGIGELWGVRVATLRFCGSWGGGVRETGSDARDGESTGVEQECVRSCPLCRRAVVCGGSDGGRRTGVNVRRSHFVYAEGG